MNSMNGDMMTACPRSGCIPQQYVRHCAILRSHRTCPKISEHCEKLIGACPRSGFSPQQYVRHCAILRSHRTCPKISEHCEKLIGACPRSGCIPQQYVRHCEMLRRCRACPKVSEHCERLMVYQIPIAMWQQQSWQTSRKSSSTTKTQCWQMRNI